MLAGWQADMDGARDVFADADLVFFDPDNGIEIASVKKGRKDSSKFVYLDEIGASYAAGKSALSTSISHALSGTHSSPIARRVCARLQPMPTCGHSGRSTSRSYC